MSQSRSDGQDGTQDRRYGREQSVSAVSQSVGMVSQAGRQAVQAEQPVLLGQSASMVRVAEIDGSSQHGRGSSQNS